MKTLLHDKKVAIIGAGPVGLTMAILLQQQGADVKVYERDADPLARIWGGTLDLHQDTGQKALKQAGLLQHYLDNAKPMGRTIADRQGNVLFEVPKRYDSPEINRNHLRAMLLDNLYQDTVIWGCRFTSLQPSGNQWLLQFENDITATADLVIGANGGMSNARSFVTDARVVETGTFIIQGEVYQPEINCADFYSLCNGNILMIAADSFTLVANPDNNGALTYAVTMNKPAEWQVQAGIDFKDTKSVINFLRDMFTGWANSYHEVFKSTAFFAGLPSRKISLEQPWHTTRALPITLIGDAAHLMPPFAGQGVNTGLMDAMILAGNLTNGTFASIAAAINDYEQQMMIYAKAAQQETAVNEAYMHSPDFTFGRRFNDEA